MKRMKTFLIYLLLVLAVVLSTDFLSRVILETNYRYIENYEITTTSPKIEINESKATKANGRIKGTITNNTEKLMENVFIKVELKGKTNTTLGTKYEEIRSIKPGESKDFSISYRYSDVDSFIVSTEDHKEELPSLEDEPLYQTYKQYYLIIRLAVWCVTPAFYFLPLFLFTGRWF